MYEVSDKIVATGNVEKGGNALKQRGGILGSINIHAATGGAATVTVRGGGAAGTVIGEYEVAANTHGGETGIDVPFVAHLHITIAGTAPDSCYLRYK